MKTFHSICVSLIVGLTVNACTGAYPGTTQQQRPRQGQYQRPAYLQPEPTAFIPASDVCRSRLYLGLVGQHEGGIVFATLPGRTRVVKPARREFDQDDFLADMNPSPPLVEIREYLAGQPLYAPSIQSMQGADGLGPNIEGRLTVELDAEGYVRDLSCR
jgi:hypothetical protein